MELLRRDLIVDIAEQAEAWGKETPARALKRSSHEECTFHRTSNDTNILTKIWVGGSPSSSTVMATHHGTSTTRATPGLAQLPGSDEDGNPLSQSLTLSTIQELPASLTSLTYYQRDAQHLARRHWHHRALHLPTYLPFDLRTDSVEISRRMDTPCETTTLTAGTSPPSKSPAQILGNNTTSAR